MNNNLPKLRFSEFDGEWERTELGRSGTFMKGSTIGKKDLSKNGEPCILYGELYTKYGEIVKEVKSKTNYITNQMLRSKNGDVLIPSSGETASDIATCTCVLIDNVIIGGDINLYRSSTANGIFISYALNHKRNGEIAKLAQGASVVHIYSRQLEKIIMPTPSLPEQTKIANFLSLFDTKIEQQAEKVATLEEYKKGLMQKIFSREIRFKDDDGNDYPEWDKCTLHDIGTISSGVGFSETHQGQKGLEISVYKVSDMNIPSNSKYMVEANNYVSKETCKAMNAKCINRAAIIFAKVGAAIFLERKKITTKPFLVDNNMMYLMPHDVSNIEFAYYLMSSIRLSKYAQVGALPSYNASDIGIIKIELPTLTEQTKIANFLSLFDRKIEKEKKKLDALREQKKALLQQMFV